MQSNFNIDDIVVCKKDKIKCIYHIKKFIDEKKCIIQGINYRIIKNELVENLEKASDEEVRINKENDEEYHKKIINILETRNKQKYLLGKVLHIDGDQTYLNKCLDLYEEIGVYAYGVCLNEEEIYNNINDYIYEVNPDVIVITGHDLYNDNGLKDINNYTNTKYFIKAIKEIKKFNQDVCIIAGACQSNFEALIASGANFASSPGRINVHTFDPAVIAIKVATTSFRQLVDIKETYKYIENGNRAFGGVQTVGKMRLVL